MALEVRGKELALGETAPDFHLPATDGIKYRLYDFKDKAKAVVVIFACNHCPYVQAYEDRMFGLCKKYQEKGVQFLVINANETKNYPEDTFPKMVERAKAKKFPYPYLRDEDQSVAVAFGAGCTPEIFLLDGSLKLRYHGRIDDNWQNPGEVKEYYLKDAIEDLLSRRDVGRPKTHPIGCSIKWG